MTDSSDGDQGQHRDSKSEGDKTWFASGASEKIFLYPHFSECGGYKQANVSFEYTEICYLVVA